MSLTKEDLQAIGALLEPIKADIADLKQGQARLEQGQEQIREDIADVKLDIKYIWQETEIIDKRVKQHEREFHSVR